MLIWREPCLKDIIVTSFARGPWDIWYVPNVRFTATPRPQGTAEDYNSFMNLPHKIVDLPPVPPTCSNDVSFELSCVVCCSCFITVENG